MKKTTLAISLLCLSMSSVQAHLSTENETLPTKKQIASKLNQHKLDLPLYFQTSVIT